MSDPLEPDDRGLDRASLKEAAFRGVRWVVLGRAVAETAALASTVVVARLVSPTEFGYAAPAAFFFALASGLTIGSFGTPLVQARSLTDRKAGTALALSVATGVAGTVVVLLGAPLLSGVFPGPTIALLQLTAPCFLIYSVGAVSQALIQRDLDFRRGSLNEVLSLLPGTVATVTAAFAGLGGASIVLGFLAQSLFSTAQVVYWRRPPVTRVDRASAREILGFGLPASASSLLFTMQKSVSLLILGGKLPAADVGFFWRASQLGIEYQGKISGILLRLLFPLLARTRSRDDLRAVRGRMVTVHAALIFPLLALLVVVAPVLIPWLYGDRWAPAASAAQILAVAGFVATIGTGTGPTVMAAGRPGALTTYNAVSLAFTVVVLLLAAPYGLVPVCIAIAVSRLLNLLGTQYFLVQRIVGIPFVETVVRDVLPALSGCAALVLLALPLRLGLVALGAPAFVTLVACGFAGLGAYGVALRALHRRTWTDLTLLFGRLAPGPVGGHRPTEQTTSGTENVV